jgi:hypothetical protein
MMFTRSEGQSVFNSVLCVGAAITKPPTGEAPEVQLTMVYLVKETGMTFGTCPVQTHLLSSRTLELAQEFLTSAEEDFGGIVFGDGEISEPGEPPKNNGLAGSETQRKGLGWKG